MLSMSFGPSGVTIGWRKATTPGLSTWTSPVSALNRSRGLIVKTGVDRTSLFARATIVLQAAQAPLMLHPSPWQVLGTMYGIRGGLLFTGPQSRCGRAWVGRPAIGPTPGDTGAGGAGGPGAGSGGAGGSSASTESLKEASAHRGAAA